jgi:hypothetical protein
MRRQCELYWATPDTAPSHTSANYHSGQKLRQYLYLGTLWNPLPYLRGHWSWGNWKHVLRMRSQRELHWATSHSAASHPATPEWRRTCWVLRSESERDMHDPGGSRWLSDSRLWRRLLLFKWGGALQAMLGSTKPNAALELQLLFQR